MTNETSDQKIVDLLKDERIQSNTDISDLLNEILERDSNGLVIRIPSGHYRISKPVHFNGQHVSIQGAGPGVTTLAFRERGQFQFGAMRRLKVGIDPAISDISPGHWVDLRGKFDASVPASQARFGWRTWDATRNQRVVLTLPRSHSLAVGLFPDGFKSVKVLNINTAFFSHDGTLPHGPYFGAVRNNTTTLPYVCFRRPNGQLVLRYTIGTHYEEQTVMYTAWIDPKDLPIEAGQVTRVRWELDAEGGQLRAYVGIGTNPTMTRVPLSGVPTFEPGPLAENYFSPLNFGLIATHFDGMGHGWGVATTNAAIDLTLAAFKLQAGRLTTDNGIGTPLRRLDNGPVNDQFLLFDFHDPSSLGLMEAIHGPDHEFGPYVRFRSHNAGGGQGARSITCAYPVRPGTDHWENVAVNATLGGFTLATFNYRLSPVQLNRNFNTRLHDIHVLGDAIPTTIDTPHGVNQYVLTVERCHLAGWDASFHLAAHMANFRDCRFERPRRHGVRTQSANLNLTDCYGNPPVNSCEALGVFFRGSQGGVHRLNNMGWNIEATSAPQVTAYYYEPSNLGYNTLVFRDSGAIIPNDHAPFVTLYAHAGSNLGTPRLIVEGGGVVAAAKYVRVNDADGQFRARIETHLPNRMRYPVENVHPGSIGKVVVHASGIGRETACPPEEGTFERNSIVLYAADPKAGEYREWHCIKSGTVGTETPPQWLGANRA